MSRGEKGQIFILLFHDRRSLERKHADSGTPLLQNRPRSIVEKAGGNSGQGEATGCEGHELEGEGHDGIVGVAHGWRRERRRSLWFLWEGKGEGEGVGRTGGEEDGQLCSLAWVWTIGRLSKSFAEARVAAWASSIQSVPCAPVCLLCAAVTALHLSRGARRGRCAHALHSTRLAETARCV